MSESADLPEGSTPLDPDEAEGLIPTHFGENPTRSQVNEWEQLNIAQAMRWAFSKRRRRTESVLAPEFAQALHRRMFDETWSWAGQYRRTLKNIGVPPEHVRIAVRERLADGETWDQFQSYPPHEIAARLHYNLVVVHPWPNGNGRWSRLMADTYLYSVEQPPLTWGGGGDLVSATQIRKDYLESLRAADRGDFGPLLSFVRR